LKYTTEQIGQLIRDTRKKLGVTQRALALTSGTGLRFVIDLEKSDVPVAREQDLVVSDASAPIPLPQRLVDHAAAPEFSFPGNPFKVENVTPNGGTIYGVPICGMLLILVAVVTRIYGSRSSGRGGKTDCHAWAISLLIPRSVRRRRFKSSCCA
jgi:hypothetical protein